MKPELLQKLLNSTVSGAAPRVPIERLKQRHSVRKTLKTKEKAPAERDEKTESGTCTLCGFKGILSSEVLDIEILLEHFKVRCFELYQKTLFCRKCRNVILRMKKLYRLSKQIGLELDAITTAIRTVLQLRNEGKRNEESPYKEGRKSPIISKANKYSNDFEPLMSNSGSSFSGQSSNFNVEAVEAIKTELEDIEVPFVHQIMLIPTSCNQDSFSGTGFNGQEVDTPSNEFFKVNVEIPESRYLPYESTLHPPKTYSQRFVCPNCCHSSPSFQAFKSHIFSNHEGERLQCFICSKIHTDLANFLLHTMTEHKFRCHPCRRDFLNEQQLARHNVGHKNIPSSNISEFSHHTDYTIEAFDNLNHQIEDINEDWMNVSVKMELEELLS